MKETRTATFKGKEYSYVFHDVDSIKEQAGVERLAGVASHPEGASHATWGTFVDEAEVRDRHWHFEPGDVVLDIGPAFGSYTLTAALQGARVFAFEPCEFCRAILQGNLDVNPELAKLVTVFPVGVHERTGWFEPNEGKLYDDPGSEKLRVARLDDLVDTVYQLGGTSEWTKGARIAAIKLDVEGAELGALKSGPDVLRIFKPRLLIEEHEFKEKGIGSACEVLLSAVGYGPPVRVNHGAVEHAYYERPA